MAKITKVNTKRSAFSAAAFAAANPSAAVETGADDRMVLLVRNTAEAAKTLTVKAGTALQGVADLEISVPASTAAGILPLESGKCVQVSGENAGCIFVEAEAGVELACAILP